MLLAAVGIVVAIGAVVVLVRESSTPMARESDAGAEAGPGGDRPGEAGIGHLTWTKSALPDGEHPLEARAAR